jgi:hypothetical protein
VPFYKLKEFKNDKILRQMSQLVENKEDLLDAENVSLLCYLLRTKQFMLKSTSPTLQSIHHAKGHPVG